MKWICCSTKFSCR